jgi:hypothetical protein
MPPEISKVTWLISIAMIKTVKFLATCQLAVIILEQHTNCHYKLISDIGILLKIIFRGCQLQQKMLPF